MREQFPLQPEQTERLIESMSALQNSPRNRLLVALPPSNLKHLMPELEFIRCHRDQVLMDADSSLDYVFFPETGVVSVVAVYADGSIIEMATIGREGCTAVQAVFGAKRSSVRLLVQIPRHRSKDVARGVHTGHGVDEGSEMSDSMPERPKTEIEPIDSTRLRKEVRKKVDAWIAAQPEPRPTRSEAIERLLAEALARQAAARAIAPDDDGGGAGVMLRKAGEPPRHRE